MIERDTRGWWWSFNIYNYLTRETHAHSSKHPFETYKEALQDLLEFLKKE
jgi:hypothetical protein